MKTYQGQRNERAVSVIVFERGNELFRDLDPKPSQSIRNHSPDGFEWGYCGSGPAQLALAILLDYFGAQPVDQRPAMETAPTLAARYYQQFKDDVVGAMPGKFWQIDESDIRLWLEAHDVGSVNIYQIWRSKGWI